LITKQGEALVQQDKMVDLKIQNYKGLKFNGLFTQKIDPYNIPMKQAKAEIKDSNGKVLYSQDNLEFPETWSQTAINIVASKYFKDKIGNYGRDGREYSIKQLADRVTDTITKHGIKQNLFNNKNAENFKNELIYILLNQYASFNSPVWFNVGLYDKYKIKSDNDEKFHFAWDYNKKKITNKIDIYERPQASACFISSIEDNMSSILDLAKREGMLFKWGSGNGTNYSTLRGFREPLNKGGNASGALYFLILYDYVAKIVKSGGKTRRAAKMVILNDDHPDIFRFIEWKGAEEKKAKALQAFLKYAPKDKSDLDDEAHFSITGQNENNSVRLSDKFVKAYLEGREWALNYVTAKKNIEKEKELSLDDYMDDRYFLDKKYITKITNKRKYTKAMTLMDVIARESFKTGDPAVQFDDIINEYNTCPNSGKINASNPCSEYMFLDNSACNLASINLTKFLGKNDMFDVNAFKHVTEILITAQEILVDYASYPGRDVAQNSHDFRPLGLGFVNLGALLMREGLPYDSCKGRALASSISSLMTATAYNQSAKISEIVGPFPKFNKNKEPFYKVMRKHKESTDKIDTCKDKNLEYICNEARVGWRKVLNQKGFRNAQTTVIAPTGTIGFMMDVDTTGIEPVISPVAIKNLSGGGTIKIVNTSVKPALKKLEYSKDKIEAIISHVEEYGSFKDAPYLKQEHLPIFATSIGDYQIFPMGHIDMMSAVQPFISGGISKTVNLPLGTTVDDIKNIYIESHKRRLKSIAIYVEGSKGNQPLNAKIKKEGSFLKWGERRKLPDEIDTFKVKVKINNVPVHLQFGEYPDTGFPGEFFIGFGSAGSDYSNTYESFGKAISRAVQYGEPLEKICKDHLGSIGAIRGFTDHPYIKSCSSIEDFMAKFMLGHYLEDVSTWNIRPKDKNALRINYLRRLKMWKEADKIVNLEDDNIKLQNEPISMEINMPKKELNKGFELNKSLNNNIKLCVQCGSKMLQSGANCWKCPTCFSDTGCG